MRTFVQLKDGIGFAYVNTEGETEGIEVPFGTGESYLNKKHENGLWSDAPLIWFAEVNHKGRIMEVKKTYFPSEVGNNPLFDLDMDAELRWINGEWVKPETPSV